MRRPPLCSDYHQGPTTQHPDQCDNNLSQTQQLVSYRCDRRTTIDTSSLLRAIDDVKHN
jgi:hypothetical protein